MHTRGRFSLAALTSSPLETIPRLSPPDHLNEEQRQEWIELVNSMPAEHFSLCNKGILELYVCHLVSARDLTRKINGIEKRGPTESNRVLRTRRKKLGELTQLRIKESNAATLLARSMRLTQQAIYRGEVVRHQKLATIKPWDRTK